MRMKYLITNNEQMYRAFLVLSTHYRLRWRNRGPLGSGASSSGIRVDPQGTALLTGVAPPGNYSHRSLSENKTKNKTQTQSL